jgi:hypothetical protein
MIASFSTHLGELSYRMENPLVVKTEKKNFKRTGLRIRCNNMKAEESGDKDSSTEGSSGKDV